jgi:hypothetical protein
VKTAARFKTLAAWLFAAGGLTLMPLPGWACTACFGKSDSPLAAGMNWGILSLLGFIALVLAGVTSAGVFLARKSAAHARAEQMLAQAEVEEFSAAVFDKDCDSAAASDARGGLEKPQTSFASRRLKCRTAPAGETVSLHR